MIYVVKLGDIMKTWKNIPKSLHLDEFQILNIILIQETDKNQWICSFYCKHIICLE